MITLSLLHPLHKTPIQSWTFDQIPVVRIGRSTDNHVILYSAVVSRHHVEIHRGENGWFLKSLGTNGTYLDGKRINEMQVEDGIVIRLARSGPNIQIHTIEEKRDPLKELLSNRRKLEVEGAANNPAENPATPPGAENIPHQTTIINN